MENCYDIFKDKTVLVTGHTGFKGSWMSMWLHMLGAKVVGYSLDPYTPRDNFVLSNIGDKIVDIRGDIRDERKLTEVIIKHEPEIIFHFAAQPIVTTSYKNPKETYEINIMGTVNLLEAVRICESVKVIVVITSDKCYENKEWEFGYRENDSLGGYDPYSSSKAAVELLVSSYRKSYFNKNAFDIHGKALATARAGNVIGGGDWSKDRIIPDCIRSIENNEDIILRNPYAVRPWQHVLEPLSGYLLLASRMLEDGKRYSGAWNFGPEYEEVVRVEDLVDKAIADWGECSTTIKIDDNPIKNHETNILYLDCNKAKKILGWYPKLSLEDSVKLTVSWYKNYLNNDVYEMCTKQIREYMDI